MFLAVTLRVLIVLTVLIMFIMFFFWGGEGGRGYKEEKVFAAVGKRKKIEGGQDVRVSRKKIVYW